MVNNFNTPNMSVFHTARSKSSARISEFHTAKYCGYQYYSECFTRMLQYSAFNTVHTRNNYSISTDNTAVILALLAERSIILINYRMFTDYWKGFARFSMKQQTSRERDVGHRKQNGLRNYIYIYIMNCVVVGYSSACWAERRSAYTTVLDSITQVE